MYKFINIIVHTHTHIYICYICIFITIVDELVDG